MSGLHRAIEQNHQIIYPFIKQICSNDEQEQWFAKFYFEIIVPYAQNLVEKTFIAQQKIERPELQLSFMKQLFEFDCRTINKLPDAVMPLYQGIKEISPLVRQFENEYFLNIWHKRPGFYLDSFYPKQHSEIIAKLIRQTLLFWMHNRAIQLLDEQPGNMVYENHKTWIEKKLRIHNNNTKLHYKRIHLQGYQPNTIWYFLNGAQRLPIFFQVELMRLRNMINQLGHWVHTFANEPVNKHHIFISFPASAFVFSMNLIFIVFMPYRFLRTLTNEIYSLIIEPINQFASRINPNFKQNNFSHLSYILFCGLLYCSLLTLFSLPIFPIPISWAPSILFSSTASWAPVAYLFCIPALAIVWNVYSQEGHSHVEPSDEINQKPKPSENFNLEQDIQPILNYYRDLTVRDKNKRVSIPAPKVAVDEEHHATPKYV